MFKIANLRNSLAGTPGGIIALLLWSCYPPVMVYAKGINPFLCAGVLDGVAFIVFFALQARSRQNPFSGLKSLPAWVVVSAIAGIGGHEVALAAAFQSAPPLEVTFLNYMWPLFLLTFSAAMSRKAVGAGTVAAAGLGFGGMFILLCGRGLSLMDVKLCYGHLWALISALAWSFFSITCCSRPQLAVFSIAFFVSAFLDFGIWLSFGETANVQAGAVAILGIASVFFALAYFLWGFAMERGNSRFLSIVSFSTPVLSAVYLIVLGQAQFNAQIVIALVCVVSAIGIARSTGKAA